MAVVLDRSVAAAILVVLSTLFFGLTAPDPVRMGDGTASVEIVSPHVDRLAFEEGRFGAAGSYLRLPDLVVEATNVTGRPRVVYAISIPRLDLDRRQTRLLRREGRLRLHMADRAYPPATGRSNELPEPGVYTGHLVVRVQSFSTDRIVLNRTLTVRVQR